MLRGSIATRTMGVASWYISVNAGHATVLDKAADLRMQSSRPPIPTSNAVSSQYHAMIRNSMAYIKTDNPTVMLSRSSYSRPKTRRSRPKPRSKTYRRYKEKAKTTALCPQSASSPRPYPREHTTAIWIIESNNIMAKTVSQQNGKKWTVMLADKNSSGIMCMCNPAWKSHPQNDLHCVRWYVKPYSLTHSLLHCVQKKNTDTRFLLYLRGKCLDFHKIFREWLGGNAYSIRAKQNTNILCYQWRHADVIFLCL